MSLSPDGRRILCDGEGCSASAVLPIGLRNEIEKARHEDKLSAEGWLFVNDASGSTHYCRRCAADYLADTET